MSFETKLLSPSVSGPRDRTIRQLGLPYHVIEPTVIATDLIIVVAISVLAGIATVTQS